MELQRKLFETTKSNEQNLILFPCIRFQIFQVQQKLVQAQTMN